MVTVGDRLGVAVSGGGDSVCLLHVLLELVPQFDFSLHVIHINHKLRGSESDADADFVRELAHTLRLPLTLEEIDVASSDDNLEQAARHARLALFRNLRDSGVVDRVATGHTRSDQAETVLYRFLRGSGTAGLSGILPATAELIRPLIDCPKEEVLAYIKDRGLKFREDSSNVQRVFVRNRIRHDLLPMLAADYNPAIVGTLAAISDLARDEESWWEQYINEIEPELIVNGPNAVLVRADRLIGLHPAVGRRLLRRAVRLAKGDLRGIDLHHIESILTLARGGEGHGRCQTPGLDVFRSFEWLRLAPPTTETRWERDYAIGFVLHGPDRPDTLEIPRTPTRIYLDFLDELPAAGVSYGYNTGESWLDADKIEPPVELRNWHPGDELWPIGRSKQKIKLLFQEHRIPIWERQSWPVLTGNGKIVWAREFGTDSACVPGPESRRIIRLREQSGGDSRESKRPV